MTLQNSFNEFTKQFKIGWSVFLSLPLSASPSSFYLFSRTKAHTHSHSHSHTHTRTGGSGTRILTISHFYKTMHDPEWLQPSRFILRAVAIFIKSWLVSVLGKVFIRNYETRPPTHFLHFTAHRFWKTDQLGFSSSFFFRENRINRLVSDWFSVTTGKVEY